MNAQQRKTIQAVIDSLQKFTEEDDVKEAGAEDTILALEAAKDMLESERDDEQEKFDNMPEGLQGSEKGEKMEQGISDLDTAIHELEDTALAALDIKNLENDWYVTVAHAVQYAIEAAESAIDN